MNPTHAMTRTDSVARGLAALVLRPDGWPRGPRQLWWVAVAILRTVRCSRPETSDGPRERIADATQILDAARRAGGVDTIERSAHLLLAAAYCAKGDLDHAARHAAELAPHPSDPAAGWAYLATLDLDLRRYVAAETKLRRGLEDTDIRGTSDDGRVTLLTLLATTLAAQGRYDDAEKTAIAAMELARDATGWCHPDHPAEAQLCTVMGHVAESRADPAEVIWRRRAVDLSTGTSGRAVAVLLARALHAHGDHEGCTRVLRGIEPWSPNAEVTIASELAHQLLVHLDEPAEGRRVLEAAIPASRRATATHQARLHLARADAALHARDYDIAADAATEAVALARLGNHTPVRDDVLTRILAAEAPRSAQVLSTDEQVRALLIRGQALAATGDVDAARETLQEALGVCHTDVLVRGQEAVEPELEDRVTAELRAVLQV